MTRRASQSLQFVSVKINGIRPSWSSEKCLNFTVFGPPNSCGERMHVVRVSYSEGPVGPQNDVHTAHSTGGANVKSLVTNDETEFKTLTFRTY